MRLGNDPFCRGARFIFIITLHVAWCGHPKVLSAQNRPGTAAASNPPAAEQLKYLADEMAHSFAALKAAEKQIPRDTFDPAIIVDQVGRDPLKLLEWVPKNTFSGPSRGALRDPVAVLMDGRGKSRERLLL